MTSRNIILTESSRIYIFLAISFITGLCYAAFYAVFAIISSSVWYGALGGYYTLLTTLRCCIIFSSYREKIKKSAAVTEASKLRLSIFCGVFLAVTIIALSAAIKQMVVTNSAYKYTGLMIYAAAAYTFTKAIIAIVNSVKSRKGSDVTLTINRNVNLADAAVSVLALQTAMFQEFSPGQDMSLANAATGGVVCVFIMTLSIIMIVRSAIKLRQMCK